MFFETEPTIKGEFGRYGRKIPAYGSKHPDIKTWPDHELVFAQPVGPDGLQMRFYYAARRANQDDYNFELRDGAELVRTYVIKRADYNSTPVDANTFAIPDGGTLDTLFTDYGFAGDSITSLGEPLSSIYIAVQRRYIVAEINEQIYEPSLETVVNIRKTVKPSGYTLADDALVNSAGNVYEVRHGNNYHDVLIWRYLSAGDLADRTLPTIYGAQKFDGLPPRLDSADMVYRSAWVTRTTDAGTSAQFSEDFFIDFNISPASSGPFKTRIERIITSAPETAINFFVTDAILLPTIKQEDVSVAYAAWSTDPPAARAVARQYRVPPSFHEAVAISINGVNGGSDRTPLTLDRVISPSTIPANPTDFTDDLTGTYLIDVDVQKIAMEMFLVTATKLVLDGIY